MPDVVEKTVVCQGCENECEVSLAFIDGHFICLGGNNCPTGEVYAISQQTSQNVNSVKVKATSPIFASNPDC